MPSFKKIDQWQPHLNAFLEIFYDQASRAGWPVAVKDVICTIEGHTTAASRLLQKFRSPFEATVITKLKKAGAIIIGKTNLDEFAMGSSTEYSACGVTKNPWDLSRVAGGSSGGSTAVVACGAVPAALGTETGGSIRQPASFCGVVGLKPTYGRVSRFGVIAYGSSLDQVGPIARTVKEVARLLKIIAGHDPRDATSDPRPVPDYTKVCGKEIKGLRIGLPKEYFGEGIDKEVGRTVLDATQQLKKLGASLIEISLPLTNVAIPTYFLIAKSEASTNLARYDALRYGRMDLETATLLERYMEARGRGFGPEVKRAILMGTYALSAGYYHAWYQQASKLRTLIRREFDAAFKNVDVIASPTTPEIAFPIGSKSDPLSMYLSDALTCPQNVAGIPAISIPCGFSNKLPVGLQLTAPSFQEERLFRVAHAYEQSQQWYKKTPLLQGT
ncbi:MAG: Asp-tRNA(Asn)/Glu-tRNA(Gln) amidotransferase subunit GatA [bacterium]